MQPYLWWKKYLTTLQMAQFCIIFFKSLMVVLQIVECGYPWQFSCISISLEAMFFALFVEYFVNEYIIKSKELHRYVCFTLPSTETKERNMAEASKEKTM